MNKLTIILLGLIALGTLVAVYKWEQDVNSCMKKNGVAINTKSGIVCIKKDILVE